MFACTPMHVFVFLLFEYSTFNNICLHILKNPLNVVRRVRCPCNCSNGFSCVLRGKRDSCFCMWSTLWDSELISFRYLIERRVWAAEAISKGSYRKVQTDSSVTRQKHSTVKNPQCLMSMTAFRDLVETQAFSFTPLPHKDECLCLRVCVWRWQRRKVQFQIPLEANSADGSKDSKLYFQSTFKGNTSLPEECYADPLVFKMTKQHFDFKLRQLKLNIRKNKIGIRTIDFCKLWTRSTRLQLMPKPGYYQGDIC